MLSTDQVHEAIGQVIVDCDILTETDYHSVSMRGELYKLGYDSEDAEQVLHYVAKGGFDYCLDPHIKMTGHHEASGEYPHFSVCHWGPDQLASRLRCLSNLPVQIRHQGKG